MPVLDLLCVTCSGCSINRLWTTRSGFHGSTEQVGGDPQWLSALWSRRCRRRLSNHPQFENTSLFHLVHHLEYFAVGHVSISAEKDIFIAARLIERLELWTQGIQRVRCLIQIDTPLFVHREHHLIFRSDLWCPCSNRQGYIQLMLQHRRCDHKNNEQHQHDIDQWSHIDLCHSGT